MLVQLPPNPVASSIAWKLSQPSQINRGEFTGKRRVAILAAAPRWSATVTLPPILGEDAVMAWRAFLVDLDGQANSFQLIACERDQITGVTPIVVGANQVGHALVTRGWIPGVTNLKRGQFVTIADQLLMLTAPIVADAAGNATILFKPYLRLPSVDAALITVKRPYALVSMSNADTGWTAGVGQNYAISFDCEESF